MLVNGQVKVKDEIETELSMAAETAATYKKAAHDMRLIATGEGIEPYHSLVKSRR